MSNDSMADAVVLNRAMTIPANGPKRIPEESVKSVRGIGNCVIEIYKAVKTTTNHAPVLSAQVRRTVSGGTSIITVAARKTQHSNVKPSFLTVLHSEIVLNPSRKAQENKRKSHSRGLTLVRSDTFGWKCSPNTDVSDYT